MIDKSCFNCQRPNSTKAIHCSKCGGTIIYCHDCENVALMGFTVVHKESGYTEAKSFEEARDLAKKNPEMHVVAFLEMPAN